MENDVQIDFVKLLMLGCLSFAPLCAKAETAQTAVEIAEAAIECRRSELAGPLSPSDLLQSMKSIVPGEGNYEEDVPYGRYELSEPIHPYGVEVTNLGIYRDWLVVEVPESTVDDLIQRLALERAPLDSEEFWFAGADDLERGFVAVFDSGSGIAFGLAAADGPTKALVGCNFLSFSRQDFLGDLDRQRKILEMFSGFGAPSKSERP
ncbi:MAG: hypothetical protein ACREPV_12150 [Lysobacter sp.]